MTTHELARRLLEGPDVVAVYPSELHGDEFAQPIDDLAPITLHRVTVEGFGERLEFDPPERVNERVRYDGTVEAVMVR